ncbi:MAG TPA: hypothetical protein VFX48_06365, partial [Saprospiraceae bacterium]|nr:hypothetical protein [Saprospiraceae bacterium]
MMHMDFLSNPKWFWFFWIAGAISILFYFYQYHQGKHLAVNLDIYRTAYLKKIGTLVLLLVLAFGLKALGKMSWATALLGLVLA